MLYHFVLTYSNWETGTICHAESFASLSEGLQNAFWELGGVPVFHRTDRMTAAVNNLTEAALFQKSYQALLRYYGMEGQRIQTGQPNENGDIEQRHYRFKRALDQALLSAIKQTPRRSRKRRHDQRSALAHESQAPGHRILPRHSPPVRRTLDRQNVRPSEGLDSATMTRRTVYARVSRSRLNSLLKNYDFPDPMQTAGSRDSTTTSLQQLFVMNSRFLHDEAGALVESVKTEPQDSAKLRSLYRKVLSRDPSPKELDLGLTYLATGTLDQYAQILLSTNEEIVWP